MPLIIVATAERPSGVVIGSYYYKDSLINTAKVVNVMMAPFYGTLENFVSHEMHVWGEDYITDLLDKGYECVLTDKGWKWLLPVDERLASRATILGNRVSKAGTQTSRVIYNL